MILPRSQGLLHPRLPTDRGPRMSVYWWLDATAIPSSQHVIWPESATRRQGAGANDIVVRAALSYPDLNEGATSYVHERVTFGLAKPKSSRCRKVNELLMGNDGSKVLVTGADGFVGRHVSAFLQRSGWSVCCASRRASAAEGYVKVDAIGPETIWETALSGPVGVVYDELSTREVDSDHVLTPEVKPRVRAGLPHRWSEKRHPAFDQRRWLLPT
jgi:hypothetical protein